MDLAFLGREDDPEKTMAVLVAKKRTSKMIMGAAAPRKATGTYIAKRVAGLFARSLVSSRRYGREERPGASLAVDR